MSRPMLTWRNGRLWKRSLRDKEAGREDEIASCPVIKKDLSALLRPDKTGDEGVEPSSTVLETDVKPFN